MCFIKYPNLPEENVSLAVIGKCYKNIAYELSSRYGIEFLYCGENSAISEPVKFHADMLAYYAGNGKIFISQNEQSLFKELSDRHINAEYIDEELRAPYPYDVALNCACVGKTLMCGKTASKKVIAFARENKKEVFEVRQGYTRCSICVVNEKSIITADLSIYKKCSEKGMEVLLIKPGYIELPGYDTGFIGGACAKINKNLLLFFGDLSCHPEQKEIREFCYKRNVEIETLQGNLTDIGGIVSIKERNSITQ